MSTEILSRDRWPIGRNTKGSYNLNWKRAIPSEKLTKDRVHRKRKKHIALEYMNIFGLIQKRMQMKTTRKYHFVTCQSGKGQKAWCVLLVEVWGTDSDRSFLSDSYLVTKTTWLLGIRTNKWTNLTFRLTPFPFLPCGCQTLGPLLPDRRTLPYSHQTPGKRSISEYVGGKMLDICKCKSLGP